MATKVQALESQETVNVSIDAVTSPVSHDMPCSTTASQQQQSVLMVQDSGEKVPSAENIAAAQTDSKEEVILDSLQQTASTDAQPKLPHSESHEEDLYDTSPLHRARILRLRSPIKGMGHQHEATAAEGNAPKNHQTKRRISNPMRRTPAIDEHPGPAGGCALTPITTSRTPANSKTTALKALAKCQTDASAAGTTLEDYFSRLDQNSGNKPSGGLISTSKTSAIAFITNPSSGRLKAQTPNRSSALAALKARRAGEASGAQQSRADDAEAKAMLKDVTHDSKSERTAEPKNVPAHEPAPRDLHTVSDYTDNRKSPIRPMAPRNRRAAAANAKEKIKANFDLASAVPAVTRGRNRAKNKLSTKTVTKPPSKLKPGTKDEVPQMKPTQHYSYASDIRIQPLELNRAKKITHSPTSGDTFDIPRSPVKAFTSNMANEVQITDRNRNSLSSASINQSNAMIKGQVTVLKAVKEPVLNSDVTELKGTGDKQLLVSTRIDHKGAADDDNCEVNGKSFREANQALRRQQDVKAGEQLDEERVLQNGHRQQKLDIVHSEGKSHSSITGDIKARGPQASKKVSALSKNHGSGATQDDAIELSDENCSSSFHGSSPSELAPAKEVPFLDVLKTKKSVVNFPRTPTALRSSPPVSSPHFPEHKVSDVTGTEHSRKATIIGFDRHGPRNQGKKSTKISGYLSTPANRPSAKSPESEAQVNTDRRQDVTFVTTGVRAIGSAKPASPANIASTVSDALADFSKFKPAPSLFTDMLVDIRTQTSNKRYVEEVFDDEINPINDTEELGLASLSSYKPQGIPLLKIHGDSSQEATREETPKRALYPQCTSIVQDLGPHSSFSPQVKKARKLPSINTSITPEQKTGLVAKHVGLDGKRRLVAGSTEGNSAVAPFRAEQLDVESDDELSGRVGNAPQVFDQDEREGPATLAGNSLQSPQKRARDDESADSASGRAKHARQSSQNSRSRRNRPAIVRTPMSRLEGKKRGTRRPSRLSSWGSQTVDVNGSPIPVYMNVPQDSTVLETYCLQHSAQTQVRSNWLADTERQRVPPGAFKRTKKANHLFPQLMNGAELVSSNRKSLPALPHAESNNIPSVKVTLIEPKDSTSQSGWTSGLVNPFGSSRKWWKWPDHDSQTFPKTRLPKGDEQESENQSSGQKQTMHPGHGISPLTSASLFARQSPAPVTKLLEPVFRSARKPNQDPEVTLVNEDEMICPTQRLKEDAPPYQQDPDQNSPLSDPLSDDLLAWCKELKPHQLDLFDELVKTAHRVTKYMVEQENSIVRIHKEFHQHRLRAAQMEERTRAEKYDGLVHALRGARREAKKCLKRKERELEEALEEHERAKVARTQRRTERENENQLLVDFIGEL